MATELGLARVPHYQVRKSRKPDLRYKPGHDEEKKKSQRFAGPVFSGLDQPVSIFPSPKRGAERREGALTIPRLRGAARTLRSVRLASRRSTAAILAIGTAR
jgi:hypothetical protein